MSTASICFGFGHEAHNCNCLLKACVSLSSRGLVWKGLGLGLALFFLSGCSEGQHMSAVDVLQA